MTVYGIAWYCPAISSRRSGLRLLGSLHHLINWNEGLARPELAPIVRVITIAIITITTIIITMIIIIIITITIDNIILCIITIITTLLILNIERLPRQRFDWEKLSPAGQAISKRLRCVFVSIWSESLLTITFDQFPFQSAIGTCPSAQM